MLSEPPFEAFDNESHITESCNTIHEPELEWSSKVLLKVRAEVATLSSGQATPCKPTLSYAASLRSIQNRPTDEHVFRGCLQLSDSTKQNPTKAAFVSAYVTELHYMLIWLTL